MSEKRYDVFLSGPISGVANYADRFADAEAFVKNHVSGTSGDVAVWNPARLPAGKDYAWYMRQCCAACFSSCVVFALPGSEESKGARAEIALAQSLGVPVLWLSENNFRQEARKTAEVAE
jgi:hypothetical protein